MQLIWNKITKSCKTFNTEYIYRNKQKNVLSEKWNKNGNKTVITYILTHSLSHIDDSVENCQIFHGKLLAIFQF